ncbi:protein FAM83C [Alosa pseudoharengus]|uniref:protein FAM83C n=1 Tax=Alosa pseudoharengus TaxID=34774 RepID=UPI003F8BE321
MNNQEALRPTPHSGRVKGKLATRLEEVKNPWRQTSTLEFSHNETARLATDALLESGEKEYRRVLAEEKELSFLSPFEIRYIVDNANKNSSSESTSNGNDRDFGDTLSEMTSGTYFPMMSDDEPPILELGWPEPPHRFGPSETQIYFQRDKTQNIKDLIRSLINKAKKVIALVMDIFTDVDLFCDLIEAANKRKVPVYILLDEKNLEYFMDMCTSLEIDNSHLANVRIRSVCGDTYCTKSGKKFTGQVQEKFMIIDCEEVLAGSYSFTWLSAHVHSNMLLHFSGRITDGFDREFRCLYADSQVLDRFSNPDDDDGPYYPAQPPPSYGYDLMQDRANRANLSEHSSTPSGSSMSSIKAAPGKPATVYRVTQDKNEVSNAQKVSDRRMGQSPVPASPMLSTGGHLMRGSPNDSGQAVMHERPSLSPTAGMDWAKAGTPEFLRANLGGPISKFQALGLYEHKNYFGGQQKAQPVENKYLPKQTSPGNFFNKFTDLFSGPSKDSAANKDPYVYRRSPTQSTAYGGPDLSQNEPESKQVLPPPAPLPKEALGNDHRISRGDEKRMTLGHSKLDLVNQYNKRTKPVYSRFELKSNN